MGDHPLCAANTTTNGGANGLKRLRSPTQKIKSGGEVPPWVLHMINIMQYRDCPIHSSTKENKLDRFCINCLVSFCNQCSSNHEGHKYIKIRRYVYCDVINRPDFQKHFDCSGIQGYVTNKNKVLFLKRRGDNQQVKEQQQNTRDRCCIICNHTLIDSFYCSIQCKVSATKIENIEMANVDNNELHNAKEEPTIITPKRKGARKGIPRRASLF